MKKDKTRAILKKYWLSKTTIELQKLTGLKSSRIYVLAREMGLPAKKGGVKKHIDPLSVEEQIALDRKLREDKTNKISVDKKYNLVLTENQRLKVELEASIGVRNGINPFNIEIKEARGDSEAVAFAIASDWHIEETVDPKTVNGMNRYTVEIAKKRAEQFFQHTLKLVKKESGAVKINTLVLGLLGDFISGNIHEELLENCSLPPIEAVIVAENILISGIEFLLKNSELHLIIPCHSGNHARITKKVHVSTERGNSLEYFMYNHMRNYFRKNPRVEFRIAEGYLSYFDCYGYSICFHHGHAVKYGGGVGGLTIPTKKAIAQWQRLRHADLHVFGHWHQFMDGGNFIVNGSMIGHNAFATFIKAEYERPKQAFFLIDRKRKIKTTVAPILFDV